MSGHTFSRTDELEFVRRIVSGEQEAEESFASRYRPRFERIARWRRVPEQDCQDVAQDALLNAIRQMKRGGFRAEAGLGTWLERIILGAIADYYRVRRRSPPLQLTEDGEQVPLDSLPALAGEAIEYRVMVREVLLGLPSESKMILLLKHVEGCTLKEIAGMLGITIGQASGKLYAARQQFREHLELVGEERADGAGRLIDGTSGKGRKGA